MVKNPQEIPFTRLDSFKNILKDTQSDKYKEYKNLIDKIADRILTTLQTEIRTSALNHIIREEIESYLKTTQTLSPKQRQRRLKEADLKRDSSNPKNPKYLEFRLNQEQAEELFNLMIMNYEASTLAYLNQKAIPHFNAIQEQDLNQREYYKEFIPFVSATSSTYNYKHPILSYKSRFLLWAILRYDLILKEYREKNQWVQYARRMLKQSLIFNFK